MAKKWTLRQDMTLAYWYDSIGDVVGFNEFGRPRGSADRRVKLLKERGVWRHLKRAVNAEAAATAYHTLAMSRDSFAREVAVDTLKDLRMPLPPPPKGKGE